MANWSHSFIVSSETDGVVNILNLGYAIPSNIKINYLFISSEDIVYVLVPNVYEGSNRTAHTDGTTTVPAKFIAVGGDFPPISQKLLKRFDGNLEVHYVKVDGQAATNRVSITIDYDIIYGENEKSGEDL